MIKFKTTSFIASVWLIFLTSCTTARLGNVTKTRENYNLALNQSDNEQFLLNIVRMHFDKSPYFVGVDSITTQTTLKFSSGGDDTKLYMTTNGRMFPPLGPFWKLQPTIEFTQSPTITYSPLQGTSYISGLLTAIDITKFYYLVQTNLSLASVFKLTVDQVGRLQSSTEVWQQDKKTQQNNIDNSKFNSFVDTLDQMRMEGRAGLYLANYKGNQVLLLALKDTLAATYVAQALGLERPYQRVIFSRNKNKNSGNVVKFHTRSFFAVLNVLSKGVIASDADDKRFGVNEQVSINSGPAEPIYHLTDGLFKMQSSESEPKNSTNRIWYEGKWYYIPNSDITSKSTLLFVKLLYSLQAGEVTDSVWSVLNIPLADE